MAIQRPKLDLNIFALRGLISNEPIKVLFVGQKISAGSAPAGDLVENIGNSGQEDALFGAGSMLAAMVRAGRAVNENTRFDAIPLDDDGGTTAAAGDITFTGTATEDGTYTVIVGSARNNTFEIAVSDGDTATVVGDALAAAINADTRAPATAVNTLGVVDLTANNGGTVGNQIGLRIVGEVAGLTTALTAFSGGAVDPSLTGVFDPIEGERYQTIVWPYVGVTPTHTDLQVLSDFLDARLNVPNNILDGVGFAAYNTTLALGVVFGNTQNSQSVSLLSDQQITESEFVGPAHIELPYVSVSQLACNEAKRLTTGTNISNIVTAATASRDGTGGIHTASLPLFNTPFPNIATADIGDEWIDSEVSQLNDAGVSVLGNNKANTNVLSADILTTRKTDDLGNPETVFKYLNQIRTASNVREFLFNNLQSDYAQARLSPGDVIPNHNIVTVEIFEAALDRYYVLLSQEGFALTVAGEEALQFFKANRVVTADFDNQSLDASLVVPIVGQFRSSRIDMFFTLSVNQV